jgi:hypothetical protein
MRCLAAASSGLRHVLARPPQAAEFLGVSRGALYLRTAEPPGAVVVLSHDAVRLPCSLVLATTSAELPLSALAPASGGFVAGDHEVRWAGPAGPVVVRAAREWAPARPSRGVVTASALAAVRSGLGTAHRIPWCDGGRDPVGDALPLASLAAVAGDADASAAVAAGLLGQGPGLTPAGDDVLAGYLVGAAAFGLDVAALRRAIAVLAPARTTALAAALLWHAARGECLDELAEVAAVLTGWQRGGPEQADGAVRRLVCVGHSSGPALGLGLVMAAEFALRSRAGRAA